MNEQLNQFRKHVIKTVAVSGIDLPVVNNKGERPIVVALGKETVGTLVRRLKNAGGYASVFVDHDDQVVMLQAIDSMGALHQEEPVGVTVFDDNQASVEMFLEFLGRHPNGVKLNVLPGAQPSTTIADCNIVTELVDA